MRTLAQDEAERHMLACPAADNLKHWSKTYSSAPHLAGDLKHAESIRDLWRSYGLQSNLVRYDVLQNFPSAASLKLLSKDGTVQFEAGLTEDELAEDPTSSPDNNLPLFHGFSANGEAVAELVYANFGTIDDFRLLESKGVSVRGKIVICKYSKIFRGLKVRAAQQYGAAAAIIYTDPQEDGEFTEANGYRAYPDGPARHPTSVQRGSVDYFSISVGDPTTPGYPSLPGSGTERKDPKDAIPHIPSLPISYADALPLLKALNGRGLTPEEVSLLNHGEYRYSPIYNVIGTIAGRTKEIVLIGNHHDSWTPGAIDPVSGSAALNEVVRGLGGLVKAGWKPYRKLIIASWDSEEYGLVGSTEFAEEYAKELGDHCVAYLNVDCATNGGAILGAKGSPLLAESLSKIMRLVPSPVHDRQTVYDDWASYESNRHDEKDGKKVSSLTDTMGTGSDYTAFFHHLGIPSLDPTFDQRPAAVYQYHSNYDSFFWVEKFGDPGFAKHLAIARLWGTLAVRLAGSPLLQFRAHDYAVTLEKHVGLLRQKKVAGLALGPLEKAVDKFSAATAALDKLVRASGDSVAASHDGNVVSRSHTGVAELNRRFRAIEKSFILKEGEGLPGRTWYKHIVFAPGLWLGYTGVAFPGILESLDDGDLDGANRWVERIAQSINDASLAALGSENTLCKK